MKLKLLACPWCGHYPIFMKWHGGGRAKRHIMCRNEECHVMPSVTGETGNEAAERWNIRQKQIDFDQMGIVLKFPQYQVVLETLDVNGVW